MITWLDSEVSLAERYVQINKYRSVIIIVNNIYMHINYAKQMYAY